MTDKPKDRTEVYAYHPNLPSGMTSHEVLYTRFECFEHLPKVAQSDEIRIEFEAYKQWEREVGMSDYLERCKRGAVSRKANPNTWFCLRCNLSYHDCDHHDTPYCPHENQHGYCRGIFVLCAECWQEITPEQRVPYYIAGVLGSWPPEDHHLLDFIKVSVLEGR